LPNLNGSCLALDELKVRDIPTVDMQEIEGVIDRTHAAFGVGRRLSVSTPQSSPSMSAVVRRRFASVAAALLCRRSQQRTGCGGRRKRGCFSVFSAACR
jgi:hypothetical protein